MSEENIYKLVRKAIGHPMDMCCQESLVSPDLEDAFHCTLPPHHKGLHECRYGGKVVTWETQQARALKLIAMDLLEHTHVLRYQNGPDFEFHLNRYADAIQKKHAVEKQEMILIFCGIILTLTVLFVLIYNYVPS